MVSCLASYPWWPGFKSQAWHSCSSDSWKSHVTEASVKGLTPFKKQKWLTTWANARMWAVRRVIIDTPIFKWATYPSVIKQTCFTGLLSPLVCVMFCYTDLWPCSNWPFQEWPAHGRSSFWGRPLFLKLLFLLWKSWSSSAQEDPVSQRAKVHFVFKVFIREKKELVVCLQQANNDQTQEYLYHGILCMVSYFYRYFSRAVFGGGVTVEAVGVGEVVFLKVLVFITATKSLDSGAFCYWRSAEDTQMKCVLE